MLTEEALSFMREALPFWGELEREQKEHLSQASAVRKFRKGELLHRGNQDCSGLFLVMEGQLRAYILSETGKEITLYRLLDRDVCLFSASCAMKNITFEVFVQAEKDSQIVLVPTGVYQELLDHSPPVVNYVNELLASRFSDVMWVMEQVLFSSFDCRLASFLLDQAAIDGTRSLAITHEEIARHLGTAREVVTRMLRYFQTEGLISLSRGGVQILDWEGLNGICT